MLAGTVYFYDETMKVLKEMDLEEYEELNKEEFQELIEQLDAVKVILNAFSHNHHTGEETILYSKYKTRHKAVQDTDILHYK